MAVCVAREGNAAQVSIEGEMTIFTALELRDEMFAALQPGSELTVDMSCVTEMDSSGIQLLLMMRKETTEQGGTFKLGSTSVAAANVMATLGFSSLLRVEE